MNSMDIVPKIRALREGLDHLTHSELIEAVQDVLRCGLLLDPATDTVEGTKELARETQLFSDEFAKRLPDVPKFETYLARSFHTKIH